MKDFAATFAVCFILCYVFLLFGGALVFENIWAILILVSLGITVLITAFMHYESKIEELEERIKAVESQKESEE